MLKMVFLKVCVVISVLILSYSILLVLVASGEEIPLNVGYPVFDSFSNIVVGSNPVNIGYDLNV